MAVESQKHRTSKRPVDLNESIETAKAEGKTTIQELAAGTIVEKKD
jgi:hypothetical protein